MNSYVSVLLFWVLAFAHAAYAEDDLDREIGRMAAARIVASTIITEKAYEAFILQYAKSDEFSDYAEDEAVVKAAEVDSKKAVDAFIAAARATITQRMYEDSIASAVAAQFSYDELKEIITFVRSDVGKRYTALSYDEKFGDAMATSLFGGKMSPDPRPALERELKARFPKMKFEF